MCKIYIAYQPVNLYHKRSCYGSELNATSIIGGAVQSQFSMNVKIATCLPATVDNVTFLEQLIQRLFYRVKLKGTQHSFWIVRAQLSHKRVYNTF